MKNNTSSLNINLIFILIIGFTAITFLTVLNSYYKTFQLIKILNKLKNESEKTKQSIDIKNENFISLKKNIHTLEIAPHLENKTLSYAQAIADFKDTVAKLKYLAEAKKITFPNSYFSQFREEVFFIKKDEKSVLQQYFKWIIEKTFLEKILLQPQSTIEELEIIPKNTHSADSSYFSVKVRITIREIYFQRLLDSIIHSKYISIIHLIQISNNAPLPPLHNSIYLKDKVAPIFGNETITATLFLDLYGLSNCYHRAVTEAEKQLTSSNQPRASSDNRYQLFTSPHLASQNNTLLDPLKSSYIFCKPVPNNWIVSNFLDYSNPNVLYEDIYHTGFNNLEKWQGSNPYQEPGKFPSDPNDPTSHPLLWTKLRCYQKDISLEKYTLHFLGCEPNQQGSTFQIQPQAALKRATYSGKTAYDKKVQHVKMGDIIEGTPYRVVHYQKKSTLYKKTTYDCSELTIENLNTYAQVILIKKTAYHPKATHITNPRSIKLENTLYEPHSSIELKLKDYFSLTYMLPNTGPIAEGTPFETETYQLTNISDTEVTLNYHSRDYKIPILEK